MAANALWDGLKAVTGTVGAIAASGTQRAKINTELMFIDRDIQNRIHTFGVLMYDYVEPLTKENPNFFASDDMLTSTIRPSLLNAQREIAAMDIKRRKQVDKINLAKANKATAFPAPANNWQEKISNVSKATLMAGNDVKLQTELTIIDNKILGHKHRFGERLYVILEKLEDTNGWLPTDREIRSIYDTCRRDIEQMRKKKLIKQEQLEEISELSERGGKKTGSTFGTYNTSQLPQPPPQIPINPPTPPVVHQQYPSQQQYLPQQQQQTQERPYFGTDAGYMGGTAQQQQQHQVIGAGYGQQPQQPHLEEEDIGVFGGIKAVPSQTIGIGGTAPDGVFGGQPQQQQQFGGQPQHQLPPQSQYQNQQPQPPHDPFAAAPPVQQQQYPDPFLGGGAPAPAAGNSNWINQPNPFAPAAAAAATNEYDDPFASITNGVTSNTNGNNNLLF